MGAAKHTPGPWTFDEDDNAITPAANANLSICTIDRIDYDTDRISRFFHGAQTEANARLIAAAPELLEAGEALARYADTCELLLKEAGYQGKAEALRARVSAWIAAAKKAAGGAL